MPTTYLPVYLPSNRLLRLPDIWPPYVKLIESFNVLYRQLKKLDFTTQAPKLNVPVYLFAGREDVNAMSSIVERYYNILEAPHKELIWLNGGHGLDDSNINQFVDIMVNRVLAETYPVTDN